VKVTGSGTAELCGLAIAEATRTQERQRRSGDGDFKANGTRMLRSDILVALSKSDLLLAFMVDHLLWHRQNNFF
jgi:hypothetical protein